jgi:hypothetical protein
MTPRDEGRAVIHGAKVRRDDGTCAWKPGGKARWLSLRELVDRLATDYRIDDHAGLENAIDTAALVYRGRDPLPKAEVRQLLKSIPLVTKILSRAENDHRIADIMMDRDQRWVQGAAWSSDRHVATLARIWQIRADLEQLDLLLRRPRKRKADIKSHRAVTALETYWKSLGRKVTRDFKRDDRGRLVPMTEAMRFMHAVLMFIDPEVAEKLRSLTRHRIKRVAKSTA